MKYYGNKKFDLIVTLNALNTHQPRPYAGRLGGPWLPIRAASVPRKYGYGLRGHGGPPAGPPNNPPCVAMLFGLWGTHRGRANLLTVARKLGCSRSIPIRLRRWANSWSHYFQCLVLSRHVTSSCSPDLVKQTAVTQLWTKLWKNIERKISDKKIS